jgi:hypothetical protein
VKATHRQAAFAAGALAIISALTALISFWLPSSAAWLDRHGFMAWPVATLAVVLFIWAATNWHRSANELAIISSAARSSVHPLVPEDMRLFESFKLALPKDSNVFYWLRNRAEARSYRFSDIAPLTNYVTDWRVADRHYVNIELECAAKKFTEAANDFLSYQGQNSSWAPQQIQEDKDDPIYYVFKFDEVGIREREIERGLGERADKVLEAHNELYMTGSRLGL